MGNQFKRPFQNMDRQSDNTFQGMRGQNVNTLFQETSQQGNNAFQGMGQQSNNTLFQGMGQQSTPAFQEMGQQNNNVFPGMMQQGNNVFQGMGQPSNNAADVRNVPGQKDISSLAPQKRQSAKKQRKVSRFSSIVIGCTVILLILMGGGSYWYYQARVNALSAPPAANNSVTNIIPTYHGDLPPVNQKQGNNSNSDQDPGVMSGLSPQMPGVVGDVNPANTDYLIVVSISQQALTAYDHGKIVYNSLVTTGQPHLWTPQGVFHIFAKLRNVTFYSQWPPSSPYYYTPEHINYALKFTTNGIYLHDATWRSVFGPGTNLPHNDPQFGPMTGSHGCVNLPLTSAAWLYSWAPIGTTVQILG